MAKGVYERVGEGWTDERTAELKKLWADGLSASQIAKCLGGLTRNAVIGKVTRLQLPGREAASAPKLAKRAPLEARRAPIAPAVRRGPRNTGGFVAVHAIHTAAAREQEAEKVVALRVEPWEYEFARPWETRKQSGECSWPVGPLNLSCCREVERGGWCRAHAKRGFSGVGPKLTLNPDFASLKQRRHA